MADWWTYLEQPGDVAGTKDPVHAGVAVGMRRREVGGEHAVGGAPPPQVLARRAPLRIVAAAFQLVFLLHFPK